MANAALKLANGRQHILSAEQTIDFTNMNVSAAAVSAVRLPYGAQVVGGAVTVDTAFNGGTATLNVGDAATPARYLGAGNIAATGQRVLVPTGFIGDGSDIQVVPTFAGTPTAGSIRLRVDYVITDRATEVQPN